MKWLLGTVLIMTILVNTRESFGDLIFSENMGAPTATTPINTHIFQNQLTLSYSGSGDVRSTTASSGYTGASGGGNVFLSNNTSGNVDNNRSFIIGGINASNFDPFSFSLTFGAFKSTTASDMTNLQVSWSDNGGAFQNLTFAAQPTGGGTANWRSVSITNANSIIPSSNLSFRFVNTDTVSQIRLDDIRFEGTAVPEPCSIALVAFVGFGGVVVRRWRIGRV